MYHRQAAAATLLTVLLVPEGAPWALDVRRQYEEDLIRWALAQARLERDPSPAGKIIERVEIVREEIIARSDPWPNFLNWVHIKTKDFVVRQELLIRAGEVWDDARVDESARNLRKLAILAVVRTAACRSTRPGQVILLVVTKDLWSIRLNTNWSMVGSVLHFLDFTPTETNFLGRNKRLSLHLGIQELDIGGGVKLRDTVEIGELYVDPRLLGSRIGLTEYFDAVIAGELLPGGSNPAGERWQPTARNGELEGAYAQLRLTRPLFSLGTEWAFDMYGVLDMRQVRRHVVNSSTPPPGEDAGLSLKTVAVQGPDGISYVPRVYDFRRLTTVAGLTRSFGRAVKHNLTTAVGAYRRRYTAPEGFSIFHPEVVRIFERATLPRSEDAAYWSVGYRTYATRYLQLRNIQSFALTEDFVVGHDVSTTVSFAANLADAALGFIEASLTASYLWALPRGDLLSVWLNAGSRWQPRLDLLEYRGPFANNSLEVGVRNVSPQFLWGRVHAQVRALLRDNNIDNATSVLGSDSGLRGYATNQFEGDNLFQVNLEYRSLPINLFTLHFGFILFYDGGAVWGGPDPRVAGRELAWRYYQSVGLGVRGHFPQFDKESVRVDFGVPLSGDAGAVGTWFSFSFRQVF